MMFNKYLLLTPAATNIRSEEDMAWLMRNCDLCKSLIRSEGIYDVLDHATATCGFGGKIAIDLTNVVEHEQKITFDSKMLPEGIVADTTLLEKWGVLLLFAENDLAIDMAELAKVSNCNFIAIFDKRAKDLSSEELLWLGAANTEPTRDITLHDSTLTIDARPKHPNASDENPSRWPNIVTADEATIRLVDSRWAEYGIGEFVSSPSERYSSLKLSEGAQWSE
jgi:4-hydroxy-3-polyprenylbenzoate decarboxylase